MKRKTRSAPFGPVLFPALAIALLALSGGCADKSAPTAVPGPPTHQLAAGEDGKTHVMKSSTRSRRGKATPSHP